MDRRDLVPFDPRHFEKLASRGLTGSAEETFREIHRQHHWAGSASLSGAGAALAQTEAVRRALPDILAEHQVTTLLDLPCGDFSWMRGVNLSGVRYIGADLLAEVIEPLRTEAADRAHRFMVLDLTRDALPSADLLLCRDCLVHLSFQDIGQALANLRRSGIPLLLTTTFPAGERNEDITTGDWRPLNLEREPFNFPPPLRLISEGCTESEGRFADKSLGLWSVASLTREHD